MSQFLGLFAALLTAFRMALWLFVALWIIAGGALIVFTLGALVVSLLEQATQG